MFVSSDFIYLEVSLSAHMNAARYCTETGHDRFLLNQYVVFLAADSFFILFLIYLWILQNDRLLSNA
jgi:hypothetical protein